MINVRTVLKVADNSGAIVASCIRLLNSPSLGGAGIGDMVNVVVKKSIIKKNVKKSKEIKTGQICTAVIIRTSNGIRRWGNFFLRAGSNAVTLVNRFYAPIGSRIIGPVFREVRSNPRFSKITLIAQVLL
jgi:large subunit ribosomal protein L14